jgi:hypothetical protein
VGCECVFRIPCLESLNTGTKNCPPMTEMPPNRLRTTYLFFLANVKFFCKLIDNPIFISDLDYHTVTPKWPYLLTKRKGARGVSSPCSESSVNIQAKKDSWEIILLEQKTIYNIVRDPCRHVVETTSRRTEVRPTFVTH